MRYLLAILWDIGTLYATYFAVYVFFIKLIRMDTSEYRFIPDTILVPTLILAFVTIIGLGVYVGLIPWIHSV